MAQIKPPPTESHQKMTLTTKAIFLMLQVAPDLSIDEQQELTALMLIKSVEGEVLDHATTSKIIRKVISY